MTELHIDSKTPKFDRRNVLKGVACVPIAAPFIPGEAQATESPVIAERQPWHGDDMPEVLDALINASAEANVSMDDLVALFSELRGDIVIHICQKLIGLAKKPPRDYVVKYWEEWQQHKTVCDDFHEQVDRAEECDDISSAAFAALEKSLMDAVNKDLELQLRIFAQGATTKRGLSLKLKTIVECEWEDGKNEERLAGMVQEIADFRGVV